MPRNQSALSLARRRVFCPLLVTMLAVVAAACSGQDGGSLVMVENPDTGAAPLAVPPSTQTSSVDSALSSTVAGQGGGGTTTSAVLDELLYERAAEILGWATLSNDTSDLDRLVSIASEREDVIAACMREQGFEYYVLPQDHVAAPIVDPARPRGTPEWVERYGFAITTLAFPAEMTAPDAVGYEQGWTVRPPSTDPNGSYFAALDAAGQAEYDDAMGGRGRPPGCSDLAAESVPDPSEKIREALANEVNLIPVRVSSDPQSVAIAAEFNSCISVPGFTFIGTQSFEDYILGLASATGLITGEGDGLEVGTDAWREALAEVQSVERLLAVSFEECGGERAWREAIDPVQRRYTELFVIENTDVLTSLLADLE